MIVPLADLAATSALGTRIALRLLPGDIVSLVGGLGAGKTTLARAILAALGHKGEVPSPTFTLVETYDGLRPPVVHADFYRLQGAAELEQIGLDEYCEGAALIAEWGQNVGGFGHDPACLTITIEKVDQNGGDARKAIVEGGRDWQSRMP